MVEQGPASTKEALLTATNGQVPPNSEVVPGSESDRSGGPVIDGLLPGAQDAGRHRPRSPQRQAEPRRVQPAGGVLLAQQRRRAEVRQGDGREHRPTAGHHPRRPGAVRAPHRLAHQRRGPHLGRQLHAAVRAGPLAGPAVRRAAGAPDLPPGAGDRPDARRRFHPVGAHRVARQPRARRAVHALLLQAVRRELGGRAGLQPGHPARRDGLHRRDDDAARHRGLRPHDGRRRRLERADLRAHQGGAGGAARRPRVDQRGLQPRLPDAD